MEVLLLGCGSSVGSPVIGRELDSFDSKNFRTRSSVLITENNKNILIDTGADFRYQALRYKIKKIDIVLYTHSHADHTHGIDDLRIFSYIKKDKINCFANNHTIRDIKKNFSYIFDPVSKSARPRLKMKEVKDTFVEQGINIVPVDIKHKDWDILGYRINNFAYITDCSSIPDKSMEKLGGLDLLILDSLRFSPHESHLSVDQAIEIVDILKPKEAILTHLSSELDYYELLEYLPNNIKPGFDGLILNI